MTYIKYLENKNLSVNTIAIYSFYLTKWEAFLKQSNPSKSKIITFLKTMEHKSANTVKLIFAVIMSHLKYLKLTKLYYECLDIKLPSIAPKFTQIISINAFNSQKMKMKIHNWYEMRNWLIFSICFTTGIRISEIYQINKAAICKNKILIKGKGRKSRMIFIPKYTLDLINKWTHDFIAIKQNGNLLSYKQLNKIIKKVSTTWFGMTLQPHDLRRSYATNLLRKGVDLKTVAELLGHSNINTTSKYIHLSENELVQKIKKIFN